MQWWNSGAAENQLTSFNLNCTLYIISGKSFRDFLWRRILLQFSRENRPIAASLFHHWKCHNFPLTFNFACIERLSISPASNELQFRCSSKPTLAQYQVSIALVVNIYNVMLILGKFSNCVGSIYNEMPIIQKLWLKTKLDSFAMMLQKYLRYLGKSRNGRPILCQYWADWISIWEIFFVNMNTKLTNICTTIFGEHFMSSQIHFIHLGFNQIWPNIVLMLITVSMFQGFAKVNLKYPTGSMCCSY